MGAKFRISPKIDAQLSQRTEGRTRDDKNSQSNQNDKNTKTTKKATKLKEPEKPKELELEQTENPRNKQADGERVVNRRLVPYVDLPPKKLTGPVNQSQIALTSQPDKVATDVVPKTEPVYKNRAPVEMGLDIEKLVESLMKTEIVMPMSNLVGVSAAIQKEIKRQLTKSRIPIEERSSDKPIEEETRPTIYLTEVVFDSITIEKDESEELLTGYITGGDPVLQFLAQNPEADLKQLKQGKMTEPLRAIYCFINGIGQEECLLDAGSMIVSMSKQVAVQLGLVWDPTISITMESASGHVEQTLGVARNVCFGMGGLKLYLQVHILENPPYRVLLGKPFETLGATVIQTYEDGSSEVVIKDPNTKRIAVVPTYERGKPPEDLQKTKFQDF
jgi:hypothetical protein